MFTKLRYVISLVKVDVVTIFVGLHSDQGMHCESHFMAALGACLVSDNIGLLRAIRKIMGI